MGDLDFILPAEKDLSAAYAISKAAVNMAVAMFSVSLKDEGFIFLAIIQVWSILQGTLLVIHGAELEFVQIFLEMKCDMHTQKCLEDSKKWHLTLRENRFHQTSGLPKCLQSSIC
ncbi:hypothetical protein FRC03_000439 [Tulasnella sp. 419]|nr:hypothetical protein FRC03_000439 [Tulasnella sp. 419]